MARTTELETVAFAKIAHHSRETQNFYVDIGLDDVVRIEAKFHEGVVVVEDENEALWNCRTA